MDYKTLMENLSDTKLMKYYQKTKIKDFIYIPVMLLSFLAIDFLLLEFTVDASKTSCFFSFFWTTFLVSIITAFSPKYGKIIYAVLYVICTIYITGQYIYYTIFEKFFWIKDATVAKEGTDYGNYVLDNINKHTILLILLGVAFLLLTLWLYPKRKVYAKQWFFNFGASIIALIGLLLMPNALGEKKEQKSWDSWDNSRMIYETFNNQNRYIRISGIYSYMFRDLYNTIFPFGKNHNETYKELDEFYKNKDAFTENEYTGIFAGKNVIFVMMESMDNFLITEKYTPTLYYMQQNGINFKQHHAAIFGAGGTFNTEFTSLTGFHSPNSGNAAYEFSKNDFSLSLPNILKKNHYKSQSFHFNRGSYYNRKLMHNSLGFETHHSLIDMGVDDKTASFDSYMAENDEIYHLMTDDQPFFDFYVTYSAHLPYSRSNTICDLQWQENEHLVDETMSEEENCLFLQSKETDNFFKTLLRRLSDDHLLEDTVIVIYTDHVAYGLDDKNEIDRLNKECGDTLNERVPFIIFNYGSDMKLTVDKVTNSSDILPTVLNLLGFTPSKYYLGHDAFNPNYSGYVFFPDYSWYDGKIHYTSDYDGEITDYIKQMNLDIYERIDINNKVLESDYIHHISNK